MRVVTSMGDEDVFTPRDESEPQSNCERTEVTRIELFQFKDGLQIPCEACNVPS